MPGALRSLASAYSLSEERMILRKTVLAAGALVALLASASVGSARPTTPAANGAAAPVQCSTKLNALRPHYPDPGQAPRGRGVARSSGAGSTLRRSDHVDVGFGVLEEGHERRLPGDRLRRRRRADQRADGRFRRQRHADDSTPSSQPPRAARSCTSRSCSARSTVAYNVEGRRLGLELRRPTTIGKIYHRPDHEVERPGDQGAQSEGEPPRRDDRGRPPLGRLGHDGASSRTS